MSLSGFSFPFIRCPGTGYPKYQPVTSTDVDHRGNTINGKLICITSMKEYEGKCLEELRLEDYNIGQGRKVALPNWPSSPFSAFGNNNTSLFPVQAPSFFLPPERRSIFCTGKGTAHSKYDPVFSTDVEIKWAAPHSIKIKYVCITVMKEYESKSLEELRLEDYNEGRGRTVCSASWPSASFSGFVSSESVTSSPVRNIFNTSDTTNNNTPTPNNVLNMSCTSSSPRNNFDKTPPKPNFFFSPPSKSDSIFKDVTIPENIFKDTKSPEGFFNDTTKSDNNFKDNKMLQGFFKDITKPESIFKDTTKPESIFKDTTKPESFFKNNTKPESFFKDNTKPESFFKDTTNPESFFKDTTKPESFFKDNTKPESFFKDTTNPESFFKDTTNPESFFKDTTKSESIFKDNTKPESIFKDTTKPESVSSVTSDESTHNPFVFKFTPPANNIFDANKNNSPPSYPRRRRIRRAYRVARKSNGSAPAVTAPTFTPAMAVPAVTAPTFTAPAVTAPAVALSFTEPAVAPAVHNKSETRNPTSPEQAELVRKLQEKGVIKSDKVVNTMLAVDRQHFCPSNPYQDSPQPIGHSVNISAPHMHATVLELLKDHLVPGEKALDIGSGSGYLTVCMAHLVAPNGKVIGVEIVKELAEKSQVTVKENYRWLRREILISNTDGRYGFKIGGPFNAIHVGAAAPQLIQTLIEQLKPGGRLIMPVGPPGWPQKLTQVDKKTDGTSVVTEIMSVSFGYLSGIGISATFGAAFKPDETRTSNPSSPEQAELVRKLREKGDIKSDKVANTMLAVDRQHFCPSNPYQDTPQPIGHSVNISAPHMHATVLELLKDHLVPGEKALDIGSGSGYLTVCMAHLVAPNGKVMGLEIVKELAEKSKVAVKENYRWLDKEILILNSNGSYGLLEGSPYNAIHVGAAAPQLIQMLIKQLKPGGRLIMPVGPKGGSQKLTQVDKKMDGTTVVKEIMSVSFGSLTGAVFNTNETRTSNPSSAEQAELVRKLREKGVIKSDKVANTMLAVDRQHFCPSNPYQDSPQPIGHSVNISAPHMHATVLELLKDYLVPGEKALDIGSGSGYLTVCMAHLVAPNGKVIGVEIVKELAEKSQVAVKENYCCLESKISISNTDGRCVFHIGGPFNAIHVGAAAPQLIQTLIVQLKPGGRLIMPVGPPGWPQKLTQVDKKTDGTTVVTEIMSVSFGYLSGIGISATFGAAFKPDETRTSNPSSPEQAELVCKLREKGVIKSDKVANTMLAVDRQHFCPSNPYQHSPQSIGHSVNISAPHMHATVLELLKDHLVPGEKALDIGSGSGYLTVCMAHLVAPDGKVIGVEIVKELAEKSQVAVKENYLWLDWKILISNSDGSYGFKSGGPFNAIHVGAAAPQLIQTLIEQLKPGGRLIMPVEPKGGSQKLTQVDKKLDGTTDVKEIMSVSFGSLTGAGLGPIFGAVFNTNETRTLNPSSPEQAELVHKLREKGVIKSDKVANTMLAVDRQHFCPSNPYQDSPQSIGHSVNISAPHMHATVLELLKDHLVPGEKALDIGSGSGYLTVCMAHLVAPDGKVIGVEIVKELAEKSQVAVKENYLWLDWKILISNSDGSYGFKSGGPFNAIHVGAAAPQLIQTLIEQLKPGGRLIMPVGPKGGSQKLTQVDKKLDGTTDVKEIMSVSFGSLTGAGLGPIFGAVFNTNETRTLNPSSPEQAELVHKLREKGVIKSDKVANTMLAVDRQHFCPSNPYQDSPQSIGHSVNISAPHMHATVLELLKDHLVPGEKALDIGSGSGYLTVCMAHLVAPDGKVIGVEIVKELAEKSQVAVKENYLWLDWKILISNSDGSYGFKSGGPFNAIHVGAAAPQLIQTLIEQLKPGGRLIMPVGPKGGSQKLTQVDKKLDGTTDVKEIMSVSFGSLTGAVFNTNETRTLNPSSPEQAELVRKLREKGVIKSDKVAYAMHAVDRQHFCPSNPYQDSPQSIGHSVNISAPHMHATVLELLKDHLVPGEKALDIGSGSGYLTVCMAHLVAPNGKVIGVEIVKELAEKSQVTVKENYRWLDWIILMSNSDGSYGFKSGGPFNAIHVGAAAPQLIQTLIEQLKPGGRLIMPVGPKGGSLKLTQVDKKMDGTTVVKEIMSVSFGSLTGAVTFSMFGTVFKPSASTSGESSNSNVSGNMLDWYIKQARDAMDKGNMTEALHWKQKAQEYKEKELDKHKETSKEDTVSELHNSIVNLNISDSSYRLSNVTGSLEEAKDIINKAKEKIANGDLKKAEELLLKAENVSSETEVRDLVRQVRVGLEGGVVSTVRVESVPTESDARSDRSEPTPDQIQIVRRVMEARDDYQVLGVTSSSTKKEVTKARRNLWARLHADNNKAPGANDAYNRVSEAAKRILERVQ